MERERARTLTGAAALGAAATAGTCSAGGGVSVAGVGAGGDVSLPTLPFASSAVQNQAVSRRH